MMMNKIDRLVLNSIKDYNEKHGYMPSYRELGQMTGLSSSSSIYGHMMRLYMLGEIETDLNTDSTRVFSSRGYRLRRKNGKV